MTTDDALRNLLTGPGDLVLTPDIQTGLTVVSVLAFISWMTSFALLVHLSYKLAKWQIEQSQLWRKGSASSTGAVPTSARAADVEMPPPTHAPLTHFPLHGQSGKGAAASQQPKGQSRAPNQFLILIVNLLVADIKQSTAFVLNIKWLHKNLIDTSTQTCWAQGWFVSVGDLASSVFVMAIGVHTYFSVVRDQQLPTKMFYSVIALLWFFIYFMAVIGIIVVESSHKRATLYTRAGPWCWINSAHQDLRLALHYLWIFIALAATTLIYIFILHHIKATARSATPIQDDLHPRADSSAANYASDGSIGPKGAPLEMRTLDRAMTSTPVQQGYPPPSRHEQQPQRPPSTPFWANLRQHIFLLYPIIYVLCTTPLAASRIAIMAGQPVSLPVLCFAGAAISCNGWLDVLLYATTRRSIIFGSDMGATETGLATFAFMHDIGGGRRLGNETVIESSQRQPSNNNDDNGPRGKSRWAGWGIGSSANGNHKRINSRNNDAGGIKGDMELQGFQNGGGAGGGVMGIHQTTTTMVMLEETEEFDGKVPSGKASILPSAGLSRSDSVRSLI